MTGDYAGLQGIAPVIDSDSNITWFTVRSQYGDPIVSSGDADARIDETLTLKLSSGNGKQYHLGEFVIGLDYSSTEISRLTTVSLVALLGAITTSWVYG